MFNQPKQEQIFLGKIKNKFLKKEYLTIDEMNHHVHIVGASGYGKSVLLSHIMKDQISKGKGLLFLDLKGEMDSILEITKFIATNNRTQDLQVFHLSAEKLSLPMNILGSGTHTQLKDKIMLSLNWSEEYYKNQASSYLIKILIPLTYLRDSQNHKLDLHEVLCCTQNPDHLVELTKLLDNDKSLKSSQAREQLESCYEFLKNNENYRSLQGLRSQLEALTLSDFGHLIKELSIIDLFTAIQENKIVLIFLDSRRYGESAKAVGRFILQELKNVSARIDTEIPRHQRNPFPIIIDEFADFAQEDFISFLDRARSSKMSIILAHQELSDLNRISPEFAGRLMGNTSTLYAFLQKRPESAEIISGIAGTKTVWKTTRQTERMWLFEVDSGNGSKREVEEFNIHPNTIKTLEVGECVAIKKYPRSSAHLVKINSHEQTHSRSSRLLPTLLSQALPSPVGLNRDTPRPRGGEGRVF